jgi:hypothetical protein
VNKIRPLFEKDERKIHCLLYSKMFSTYHCPRSKGEKINDDTKTTICVNLNSKQCHKIKGYGFGVHAFTPMTRFIFLLAKLCSFGFRLPCSLASSSSISSYSLPLGHHVLVHPCCATVASYTTCHFVLIHH